MRKYFNKIQVWLYESGLMNLFYVMFEAALVYMTFTFMHWLFTG